MSSGSPPTQTHVTATGVIPCRWAFKHAASNFREDSSFDFSRKIEFWTACQSQRPESVSCPFCCCPVRSSSSTFLFTSKSRAPTTAPEQPSANAALRLTRHPPGHSRRLFCAWVSLNQSITIPVYRKRRGRQTNTCIKMNRSTRQYRPKTQLKHL